MKFFKSKKKIENRLQDVLNNKIYFGPFSALKIPNSVFNLLSVTEVLGLYESCLHPIFSILINRNVKEIIIVGGNNGYYAAGLKYFFNPENIKVYEIEEKFHNVIDSWFVDNNFKNYQILGEATVDNFKQIDIKIDLLFMDCEGAEELLLNPTIFQWQKASDILVELHPFYVQNLIPNLTKRFTKTHEIVLIYDDFTEDDKVKKLLNGFEIDYKHIEHPKHRWITENSQKVFTSGVFMYLQVKA